MSASGILNDLHTLVETTAVAAGGIWAAWTFSKLQRAKAAEVDIVRSESQAQESALRLATHQPSLEVSLAQTLEFFAPNEEQGLLGVVVELRNSGQRNLEVGFPEVTLSVGRVSTNDRVKHLVDVERVGATMISGSGHGLEPMPNRLIRAGQARCIDFVARVSSPALYVLQFEAVYWMAPFEGEQPPQDPEPIWAVEQRLVCVGAGPTSSSPRRPGQLAAGPAPSE